MKEKTYDSRLVKNLGVVRSLRRLESDIERHLRDATTKQRVRATALTIPPTLVGFDTRGIPGPGLDSLGDEYLTRLHEAVHREPYLPLEANAYVPGITKGAASVDGQVWVPIQFYKVRR